MSVKKKIIHHAKPKDHHVDPSFHALNWQTHEFHRPEVTATWYVLVALLLAAVSAGFIYLRLYTVMVGVLLAGALIIVESLLEPRLVRVEINDKGILFGDKRYHYNQIKSFGFGGSEDQRHLILETTVSLMSLIDIPLGKQSAEDIKIILAKHLPYNSNLSLNHGLKLPN